MKVKVLETMTQYRTALRMLALTETKLDYLRYRVFPKINLHEPNVSHVLIRSSPDKRNILQAEGIPVIDDRGSRRIEARQIFEREIQVEELPHDSNSSACCAQALVIPINIHRSCLKHHAVKRASIKLNSNCQEKYCFSLIEIQNALICAVLSLPTTSESRL